MSLSLLTEPNFKTWADLYAHALFLNGSLVMTPDSIVDLQQTNIDVTGASITGLFPASAANQAIFVSKAGSDTDGDGSFLYPFKTIPHAIGSITDAADNKRYTVLVSAGTYTEDFALKPFISIMGGNLVSCIIQCNITLADWAGSGGICSLQNMQIFDTSSITLGYVAANVVQGIVALNNCVCLCPVSAVLTDQSLFVVRSSTLAQEVNLTGGQHQIVNSTCFSAVRLHGADVACQSIILGTTMSGGLIATLDAAAFAPYVQCINSFAASYVLNGAGVQGLADAASLPSQSNISLLNTATLLRISDSYALSFSPAVPSDWIVSPAEVSSAIDALASYTSSGQFASTASALVNVTSVGTAAIRWTKNKSVVNCQLFMMATLPSVPQTNCRISFSLPVAPAAPFAAATDLSGVVSVACDDGFGNPSGAQGTFTWVQASVGSSLGTLRFDVGAGASSSLLMITGSFSYAV